MIAAEDDLWKIELLKGATLVYAAMVDVADTSPDKRFVHRTAFAAFREVIMGRERDVDGFPNSLPEQLLSETRRMLQGWHSDSQTDDPDVEELFGIAVDFRDYLRLISS